MLQEKVELSEIKLIGLTTRTNNRDEIDPAKSKIAKLASHYWMNQIANKINHRIHPGITYAVYTNYVNKEHDDYTYFIGEAVSSNAEQDLSIFESLDIVKSQYLKLTTPQGKMPTIVISAWQEIWQMDPGAFLGNRTYQTDFEIYDQRASDPNNAVIDIYLGIK